MKKIAWILFISYFSIFVILGLVFYWKYLAKFLASGAEGEEIVTKTSLGYIYYGQDNNLYRANPALVYETSADERVERFQSTGGVSFVDINKTGQQIAYDAWGSLGFRDIWQVDSQSSMSETVATAGQTGLKDYSDFRRPKFSPEGTQLAFIGGRDGDETIFVKNLANGKISELLVAAGLKITDYTWTRDGEKIIYCTDNNSQLGCWEQELFKGGAKRIIADEILEISADKTGNVIYLAKRENNINIFSYESKTARTEAITDMVSPREVVFFQIDPQGEKIVFEVAEANLKNIYLAKINGENLLQLTTDGRSQQPLFSPRSDEIAFLKTDDGIYIMRADKTEEKKIANLRSFVKLLLWR